MDKMRPILVVDDVEAICTFISTVLQGNGDMQVDTASDSAEVMARVCRKDYQLILMDIKLPKVDGLELLSILREEIPEVKIVMCSADTSEETVNLSYEIGAVGFLEKPVTPMSLLSLMERL